MGHSFPLKRATTILTAALMSLLFAASAAFAQYPPAEAFGVGCAPETPVVGTTTNCGVVGAVPGEDLYVTAEYNPIFFETNLVADENGEASFSFDVPAEAEGLEVTVTVVGSESGSISTSVDAIADPDAETSTGTGSDTGTEASTGTGSDTGTEASTGTDTSTGSGPDDTVAATTEVTASSDGLPRTGVESSWLIAGGALLLLMGAVTVTAARRRDRSRTTA